MTSPILGNYIILCVAFHFHMSTYLGAEMFKDRTGNKVQVVLRLQISQ